MALSGRQVRLNHPMKFTSPPVTRRTPVRILRRAALGAAGATLYGIGLGVLLGGLSLDPLGWVLGGAAFGAIGGPIFGVAETLFIPAGTRREGWRRRVRVFGTLGGVVFGGLALLLLGSAAPERILTDLGELLGLGVFGGVAGSGFGGIAGLFSYEKGGPKGPVSDSGGVED